MAHEPPPGRVRPAEVGQRHRRLDRLLALHLVPLDRLLARQLLLALGLALPPRDAVLAVLRLPLLVHPDHPQRKVLRLRHGRLGRRRHELRGLLRVPRRQHPLAPLRLILQRVEAARVTVREEVEPLVGGLEAEVGVAVR